MLGLRGTKNLVGHVAVLPWTIYEVPGMLPGEVVKWVSKQFGRAACEKITVLLGCTQ